MQAKLDVKFDTRAPPRRRVRLDDTEDQPVFLKKAFAMISKCPQEIGGWSEKGDTVIIKDVKQFAEKIIPTVYKHNNFSSFVRQLNFYGFRKIKADSSDHSEWWEFRHPKFLRDQPNLIGQIKRSIQFVENSGAVDVADLKSHVSLLTDKVNSMQGKIDDLTEIIHEMQIGEKSEPNKKRKPLGPPLLVASSSLSLTRMASCDSTGMVEAFESAGEDLLMGPDLLQRSFNADFFDSPVPQGGLSRSASCSTALDMLVEDLGGIFDGTPRETSNSSSSYGVAAPTPFVPAPLVISQPSIQSTPAQEAEQQSTPGDIKSILSVLPPELQARFVDKLAEALGTQLAQQMQPLASAVPIAEPALAEVSKDSNSSMLSSSGSSSSETLQFNLPSGGRAPEIALPLASAAIAAMFSTFPYATSVPTSKSMPFNDVVCK